MKNLKRILACALALVMVLCLVPMNIFAEAEEVMYHVANFKSGGSDSNDGKDNPFLTISHAIEAGKGKSVIIVLDSDIVITKALTISGGKVTIQGTNGDLILEPSADIGSGGAGLVIKDGAKVTFDGLTFRRQTGSGFNAGLVYVNGSELTVTDSILTNGKLAASNANDGGSAIHVAGGAIVTVHGESKITGNDSTGRNASGAIFVENGGTLNLKGGTVSGNTITGSTGRADSNCTGIYVQTGGKLNVTGEDEVIVSDSIYLEVGSNNTVGAASGKSGNIKLLGNVFLATEETSDGNVATLDIVGDTRKSNINVEVAEGRHDVYRLISKADGYAVQTAAGNMDETGWSDADGARDIRYMDRDGVPGLYFYYHTLKAEFSDVRTLTDLKGKDIRGEDSDYLAEEVQNTTVANGVLTIPELVPVDGGDFTVTFGVNEAGKAYRIPDSVTVTYDGKPLEGVTYVHDMEAGTAVLTVPAASLAGLDPSKALRFDISGEEYFELTLDMKGPLYSMETSVTGQSMDTLFVSDPVFEDGGKTVSYTVTRGSKPVKGITVKLYEENGRELSQETDADGAVRFTGLSGNKHVRYTLQYSDTFHVIGRDVATVNLATIRGENMVSGQKTGDCELDYSNGSSTSVIRNVASDSTVTYVSSANENEVLFFANVDNGGGQEVPTTADTVKYTMEGNAVEGDATNPYKKAMPESAEVYGILPVVTMTGYTNQGWFNGEGNRYTEATPYGTVRNLYARWTKDKDIKYTVRHWVELTDEPGVNPYKNEDTQTVVRDGRTYYLWTSDEYHDGVADTELGSLLSLKRTEMSDPEHDWWTMDGLTARVESDIPKVLAGGGSEFDIYYDRNEYVMTYDPGVGVMSGGADTQSHKYGEAVGTMLEAVRHGYLFTGWYETVSTGESLVTETSPYMWAGGVTVKAGWNNYDTTYGIMVWVEDMKPVEDGPAVSAGTYTGFKTVLEGNDGKRLPGTSDVEMTVSVDSIDALSIPGFTYAGYKVGVASDDCSRPDGMEPSDKDFTFKPSEWGSENHDADGRPDPRQTVVHLYYARNKATVSFMADDVGDEVHETVDVLYGDVFEKAIPAVDPTKPGYDFVKWVDDQGREVGSGTDTDRYTSGGSAEVALRPVWDARTYVLTYVPGDGVTFDTTMFEGGGGVENASVPGGYTVPVAVTYGRPVGTMPAASKDGYVFDGWFLPDGTQVSAETILGVDNAVVRNDGNGYEDVRPLTAGFSPYQHVLVFNADGGTVSPASVTVTYGESVGTLPVPSKTGYRFVGWTLDPEEVGIQRVNDGDIWSVKTTNWASVEAVASWVPISYGYDLVLNDVDYGNGSTKARLRDSTVTGPVVDFNAPYANVVKGIQADREGYDFIGWSLDKTVAGIVTEEKVNQLAEDATLYAMWRPKVGAFHVDLKDGTLVDEFIWNRYAAEHYKAFEATYGIELSVTKLEDGTWSVPVLFDTTYGEIGELTRDGYRFEGYKVSAPKWTVENETGWSYVVHGQVIKSFDVSYTDVMDDYIGLEAVWTPLLDFDLNGYRNPEAMFADGTTETKTLAQPDIVAMGELPAAQFEGYRFLGWYSTEDGKYVTFDDVKAMTEYRKLMAMFSPWITFRGNGGQVLYQNQRHDEVTVDLYTLVTVNRGFLTAEHESRTLMGWMADDGSDMTAFSNLASRYSPVTLTATWDLTVQFVLPEKATWSDGTTGSKVYTAQSVGDMQALPEARLRGHELLGWSYESDGAGKLVTPVELSRVAKSVSVYPVFSATDVANIDVNVVIYGKVITLAEPAGGWMNGFNEFIVGSGHPCGVALIRGEEKTELLGLEASSDGCRYRADLQDGDTILVVLKGDANLDGKVDTVDPTCIMRNLVGSYDMGYANLLAADANCDGRVDTVDPTCVMRWLVNSYNFFWHVK